MISVSTSKDVVEAFENTIQGGWKGNVDISDVLAFLHPEVEVIEAASLPYAGVWKGHAGFLELAATMKALWHYLPGKTFEYVTTGDRVVVLTLGTAVVNATGKEFEWRLAEVFVVRDGLIIEIRPFYYDTAAVAAAARGD